MIRAAMLAAIACGVAAVGVPPASADYDFSWGRSSQDKEFVAHMAAARAAVSELGSPRRMRERRELARRAYFRIAKALERKPDHPEANYLAAELVYSFSLYDHGHRSKWLARGIDHYGRYLASKPSDTRVRSALFNRSILFSKRALGVTDFAPDFRLAIADYDRQLAMLDADTTNPVLRRSLSTTLSNAAELHMGIGQLDRSIELYAESIEVDPSALYRFGLAVALDRDGQRLRAAEIMREAIESDSPTARGGQCALDRDGVFFVPHGDKSYYLALRAEVLGKYAEARRHYQVFLGRLGDGRYAKTARANLAAIRRKRDTWKPTTKECR